MLKLKKFSKRDKRALMILGGVAGVIAVVFGLVVPFYDAQEQVKGQLEGKERFLERYVQVIQAREVYQSQLDQLDSMLEQYRQMLLDAQDSSVATIQLEEVVRALATEHEVQVTRSTPLQGRKIGEQYAKITLQINLQTNMSQLTHFLYAISTHRRFLLVEDFFLNSFRARKQVRLQPRMNISSFIRLSWKVGIN